MSSFDFDWTTLFGETLKSSKSNKGGGADVATQTALQGKIIGIYCSAQWCPPCRSFTPLLSSFYSSLSSPSTSKTIDTLEIIFVSSDSDTKSYEDYYGTMPWVSLPFDQTPKKDELSSKFGIKSIPSLIIINGETGDLIDANGRGTVASNSGNVKKILEAWAK